VLADHGRQSQFLVQLVAAAVAALLEAPAVAVAVAPAVAVGGHRLAVLPLRGLLLPLP